MRFSSRWFTCAVLILALGCRAPARKDEREPPAAVAENPPPAGRLGDEVAPVRYELEVRLDPRRDSFSARIAIDLEVRRPLLTLWLHGTGLQVKEAALTSGGERLAARAQGGPRGSDLVGFSTGRPIAEGHARLEIEYRGKLGERRGLFRQKTGGRFYAFTDFEAVDARRALFCFDEPAFKAPWRIALVIPEEMEGLSNAPLAAERRLGGGLKRLEFEPTPPLPSYLVAFAAGPFDVVEGPKQPLPFRAVTPRGRGDHAALALKAAPPLTEILEEYLGSKVPFPKLDFLAVPRLNGAMENPGLITFSSSILLTRERHGESRRRLLIGVIAHELAHLWFGDLVTPAWWNDLWLNEAFATWMSDLAVARLWPERKGRLLAVTDRRRAVRVDRTLDAPPVRREIGHASQVRGAFHAITYRKGGAILGMLERYVGEERFRTGVRRYLEAHAGDSATTRDLSRALSKAAGRDLAPAIASFIDRPGIPLVRAELRCEEDGAHLALSQRRLLGAFDAARAAKAERRRRWHIPVCARFPSAQGQERACTLLSAQSGRLELGPSCPAWVHPNPEDAGYYHYWLPPDELRALLAGPRLSEREAVGLLLSAEALLAAGEIDLGEVFAIYAAFADRDEPAIVEVIGDSLQLLSRSVVTPPLRAAFAARVRDLYGDRARRLGVVADREDPEEVRALRWHIVRLVGDLGEDPHLRRRATERARAWLESGATIRSESDLLALRLAARGADRVFFEELLSAFRRAESRGRKMALATALGSVSDPALVRDAARLVLEGSIRSREALALLAAALDGARSRPVAFELLRRRRADLAREVEGGIPGEILARLCTEEAALLARTWGGSSTPAPAAREIARCAAFADAQRQSAARYFSR